MAIDALPLLCWVLCEFQVFAYSLQFTMFDNFRVFVQYIVFLIVCFLITYADLESHSETVLMSQILHQRSNANWRVNQRFVVAVEFPGNVYRFWMSWKSSDLLASRPGNVESFFPVGTAFKEMFMPRYWLFKIRRGRDCGGFPPWFCMGLWQFEICWEWK